MRILFIPFLIFYLFFTPVYSQRDVINTPDGALLIIPINHGSLVLQWQEQIIYIDPYGGSSLYEGIAPPDLILFTDIHGDHYNPETFLNLPLERATFFMPQAVAKLLEKEDIENNKIQIINNGMEIEWLTLKIEAFPMYNLPESSDSRHPKGRGNGYIISSGETRIYISGDTEDIPEMRQLQNIDVAFISMNLPYTMSINQAADAVLDFKPTIVYPYHYRGEGGKLSDVGEFKNIVNKNNKNIEVRLRDWYGTK